MNAFCCIFTDLQGNEWLLELGLDYVESINKFEALNGHPICVNGRYQGYSDLYGKPSIMIDTIFDQNTGNLTSSQWYSMVYE